MQVKNLYSIQFIKMFVIIVMLTFAIPAKSFAQEKANSSLINGVQIGVITYSFRSMANQSAEATLKYCVEAGISATELMGGPVEKFAGKPQQTGSEEEYKKEVAQWRATVSMDRFAALRKMFSDAGVTIYAFKPDALQKHHTDAEIEWAMQVAKTLGATHVTVELPKNAAQTQRLGDLGEKNGVYVGYHGHTKQTPTFWDVALAQSAYNGINIDLGHYIAGGNTDIFDFIKKHHVRILSMHIKDRQTPENGKRNKVWGQGDTPIAEVLQLMSKRGYTFPVTIELEYDISSNSNAVQEVKKSLDYCKKALN